MKKIILIMLFPFFGAYSQSNAQDLLTTPTRIVFEGNKQKGEVNLVNIGKDTATYSISFIQYNMTEEGGFVTIEKPDSGLMYADSYLRVYPRKVILAPGEPQVIMLQYRRKPDMLAGEYRSHLYFRAETDNKPLGSGKKDTAALSVQLVPVYGLSIPVIIRNGEVNVNCTLSNLKLETKQDSIQIVRFTINRMGNISIYGDVKIEYIPTGGLAVEVGEAKGVGVYTNINKRNFEMRLNNSAGKILNKGKLKIQYISNSKTNYKVFAQEEIEIK